MERQREHKQHVERREEVSEETAEHLGKTAAEAAQKGDELKAEMDGILDEIDQVLEHDAAEFVKSYVQKGGE